jgi:hypothetical protein
MLGSMRIGLRPISLLVALPSLVAMPAPSLAQGNARGPAAAVQHQHHTAPETMDLFPGREGSGTTWQPETTHHGLHATWSGWEVRLHGSVFAQLLYEPGDHHRTGGFATNQLSSVNWGMVMARRSAGAGRLGVRGMVSLEPWTVSDCGFLNLLATGEMCEGDTIHDRQHPHDLFMELAADYDRPLRGSLRWQVYGGLAGEPALGPGGFPHRRSAAANPVAPISHHWLDSTHIAFGVITAGLYDRRWKTEMSVFNGREPDARRADLDLAPLDSVSGRLWLMPTRNLAMQASAAHLREAEAEFPPQPRADVDRATASATYHRAAPGGRAWAITFAYGVNAGREVLPDRSVHLVTHAGLLEGSMTWSGRDTLFGRAELVGKAAHDLHAHEYGGSVFTIGKLQVGYERQLVSWSGLKAGVGGSASVSLVPPELEVRYSGRAAFGLAVFFNVRPSAHRTAAD